MCEKANAKAVFPKHAHWETQPFTVELFTGRSLDQLQHSRPRRLWVCGWACRALAPTWPSTTPFGGSPESLHGRPLLYAAGPEDLPSPPPSAQALQAIPQGHVTPIIDKKWRLRLRVIRLQGKLMAAQGLPSGPTGQSPPSPTGLGEALRRQQENETHSEWPLSHHLCSWSPPPTLSCTSRRTCMQIPQRAQRREGLAD